MLSGRFTISTMAKDDPIPVDDQSLFFRQIVDSFPELLHTARPDGYLDFFNQTWLDFTGVPLEKLLGWGWTCRIHPDDLEAFVQKMRESFAKGKPFEETSRVRRADGVYRWMLHRKCRDSIEMENLSNGMVRVSTSMTRREQRNNS